MATYAITHRQVTDNFLVVQTMEGTDIGSGQSVTLAGLGATLNGTYTVVAVPTHLFVGVDEEGDFLFDYETIILNQEWLGIASATANDTAFITTAVNAANAYAYRRRREAGYYDSLSTVPSADVKLGTIMFAGSLYRERGSVDSFASFEQMGTPVAFGSNGQINRLLGVNRSQVA